jgi:hypothetical protein
MNRKGLFLFLARFYGEKIYVIMLDVLKKTIPQLPPSLCMANIGITCIAKQKRGVQGR